MSELNPTPPKQSNAVGVTIVIAVTIVTLACILACTGTMITFILNAPWN
ncbi:MAG: hypothetical protein ABIJ39_12765 [Chloroflexota bacterium]